MFYPTGEDWKSGGDPPKAQAAMEIFPKKSNRLPGDSRLKHSYKNFHTGHMYIAVPFC